MDGWHRLNKPGDSWRWRASHLAWGLFTLFMMSWAFLLGLLVGQGSFGTPEQVASLKELTSTVPSLQNFAQLEEPPETPAPTEERLEQPQLTFYEDVERNRGQRPPTQSKSTYSAQAKPAAALPGSAAPPPAGLAPAVRSVPPVLGKLKPFRPETAPPVTMALPVPKPSPPTAPGLPQPYQGLTTPRPTAPAGPVASSPQAASPVPVQRRGQLLVQVATFQGESGARDLVNRLRAAGHPAFLTRSELEGVGPRYRVRVGPYEDIDLAQGAAGRIRIQHSFPVFVTREDQP
jgi:cell division septation protein DedD